jgi:hypothetical protein
MDDVPLSALFEKHMLSEVSFPGCLPDVLAQTTNAIQKQ